MNPEFSFVALFDLLAFVQGTLLGILLMLKKREHLSYLFLGLFLFSYSSELIVSVLIDSKIFPQYPELLYLPVSFYFLFMPCLFLYVKSLTEEIDWKKYRWIFLPAVIEFVMLLWLFFQSADAKLVQFTSGLVSDFYSIYVDVAMVYTIIYAIVILKQNTEHRKRVKNFHSNVQGKLLDWVRWICIFIIIIDLFLLSSNFLNPAFFNDYVYPAVSLVNVIFIFWVALSGFRQKAIVFPKEEDLKNNETLNEPQEKEVVKNNNEITSDLIEEDSSKVEFQKITQTIAKEKIFREPDLHLAELAKQLHISQRRLSELINQEAGLNFNQFINQFRVEDAKAILVDEKFSHLNILGIAYEVGFNSKTTFYTAFKNEVGMTPSKYQKQQRTISE